MPSARTTAVHNGRPLLMATKPKRVEPTPLATSDPEPNWLELAQQVTSLAAEDPHSTETALTDVYRVHKLLKSLAGGNYQETAILTAGFAKQTIYNWRKRAERGDIAAITCVDAMERASAWAEQDVLANVKRASKLPQFWAAGMTLLERRHPDRWARRNEDSSAPRVVVQVGVHASDVRLSVGESVPAQHSLPAVILDSPPSDSDVSR